MTSGAALLLEGVDVDYGPVRALRNVDLSVGAGERVAIVGRSGAGKSTVARLATGLTQPTTGKAQVLQQHVHGLSRGQLRRLRRRVHTVFQDPYDSLHPGLRVADLVAEPLVIAGTARDERRQHVNNALAEVGLAPAESFVHRYAASLSGGQRQRVAIARALVAQPELLIADEPVSMLDASRQQSVVDLLMAVQASLGAAMVFITHNLAIARRVATKVVVLREGEVVETGPAHQVLTTPAHPETRLLLEAVTHHRQAPDTSPPHR